MNPPTARTNRTEQQRRIVEFSRIQLGNGDDRTIAGLLNRRGAIVALCCWAGSSPYSRLFIFPDLLPLTEATIDFVRAARPGRIYPGEVRTPSLAVRVWGEVDASGKGRVCFGRLRLDGSEIGHRATIAGSELDALADACAWMRAKTETPR